jgi:flavin reductase (DIM6/NTAB) family NADH-FMN oxidoreductase RutF
VINLTTEALAFQTDWCGVKSGRDFNKFDAMKLTPGKALVVSAPIIEECPVHIECRVTQVIPLGSHDMFMAEVVAVQVDSAFLDPKTDEFRLQDAHLLAYSHGHYYPLGAQIGRFGHSVKKQKK